MFDAEHEEENPDAPKQVITKSVCVIKGTRGRVWLAEQTRAREIYGAAEIEGEFLCSYAVNPEKQPEFELGGMRFSGLGAEQEARVVELPAHPFYVATLFLPQMDSSEDKANPLFVEFVRAAAAWRDKPAAAFSQTQR